MGDNATLHLPVTNYILGIVPDFSMKLSMVAHAWSPTTWVAEARGFKGVIQASLGYI